MWFIKDPLFLSLVYPSEKQENCFWSPYFNTFNKVHQFYFISRSNEVFTMLSALSKFLIIKPSQKLIYASRDFLWLGQKTEEDRFTEKKEATERKTPRHAVCACGWQVKRMRANSPDTKLQKTVSIRSLSTIRNNGRKPFPKIAQQSCLNAEISDTLIDKCSLPHQHHASFHIGAEKVALDRGFVFFS